MAAAAYSEPPQPPVTRPIQMSGTAGIACRDAPLVLLSPPPPLLSRPGPSRHGTTRLGSERPPSCCGRHGASCYVRPARHGAAERMIGMTVVISGLPGCPSSDTHRRYVEESCRFVYGLLLADLRAVHSLASHDVQSLERISASRLDPARRRFHGTIFTREKPGRRRVDGRALTAPRGVRTPKVGTETCSPGGPDYSDRGYSVRPCSPWEYLLSIGQWEKHAAVWGW